MRDRRSGELSNRPIHSSRYATRRTRPSADAASRFARNVRSRLCARYRQRSEHHRGERPTPDGMIAP